MKNNNLASRIKHLRNSKGISQEILSVETGLSLRTIQRIENGENEPRGDSLKRISNALNVTPDELLDWTINEDKSYLLVLNFSSIAFILFPLLGVIVPLILWLNKKDKLKHINTVSKDVINFQISWSIIVFMVYIFYIGRTLYQINQMGNVSQSLILIPSIIVTAVIAALYLFNLIMISINTIRINNDKETKYFPKIQFIS